MNRRVRGWIVVLVAAVSFASACGGETAGQDDRLGGETNWLGDCSMTGECAVGECICGVCTERCTGDEDCSSDGTAVCVSNNGVIFQAACGDTPEVQSVCIGHCVTDDDCSDGTTCIEGACLPPQRVTETTDPTTATTSNSMLMYDLAAGASGQCLSRSLSVTDGSASCVVLQATTGPVCDCSGPGLTPASSAAAMFAAKQLARWTDIAAAKAMCPARTYAFAQ